MHDVLLDFICSVAKVQQVFEGGFCERVPELLLDFFAGAGDFEEVALEEMLDEGEVLEVGVYFMVLDVGLEAVGYVGEVVSHFVDEELGGEWLVVFFVELYDAGVVEVTHLFETGLVEVASDIFVDFADLLHLAGYLVADHLYVQLVVGLVQNVAVDVAESQHEQLLHQDYLDVAYLSFQFSQVLVLYPILKAVVLLGHYCQYLLEQAVLDELDFVAGSQNQATVLPTSQLLEGFFAEMSEGVGKECQIVVDGFLVDGHFGELEQKQSNVQVELPIDIVGVEESIQFKFLGLLPIDFYADFAEDLFFGEAETGIDFAVDFVLVFVEKGLLQGHRGFKHPVVHYLSSDQLPKIKQRQQQFLEFHRGGACLQGVPLVLQVLVNQFVVLSYELDFEVFAGCFYITAVHNLLKNFLSSIHVSAKLLLVVGLLGLANSLFQLSLCQFCHLCLFLVVLGQHLINVPLGVNSHTIMVFSAHQYGVLDFGYNLTYIWIEPLFRPNQKLLAGEYQSYFVCLFFNLLNLAAFADQTYLSIGDLAALITVKAVKVVGPDQFSAQ